MLDELFGKQIDHQIPSIKPSDRSLLIKLLQGKAPPLSVIKLAESLQVSDISAEHILSALFKCQWVNFQYASKKHRSNADQLLESLSSQLTSFAALQKSIVVAYQQKWSSELQSEKVKRIVADSKIEWLERGEMVLRNYFQEMPVSTKARYVQSTDEYIEVEAPPGVFKIFAVSESGREVLSPGVDGEHVIRLSALSYNHGRMKLAVRSVDVSLREKREHLRVKPEDLIHVQLSSHEANDHIQMLDISLGGIGLITNKQLSVVPGACMNCTLNICGSKICVEAMVRWSGQSEAGTSVGVQFRHLGPFEAVLSKYLSHQQQSFISRVNKLPQPDWLQ